MLPKDLVRTCPHCSAGPTPFQRTWDTSTVSPDGKERRWIIASCPACGGLISIEVPPGELDHAEQLAEFVADLAALRREAGRDPTDPYDVVVALPPGSDPAPYVAAGASWWLVEFPWDAVSVDEARAVIRNGPAAPA
jgi:hypothetical protein